MSRVYSAKEIFGSAGFGFLVKDVIEVPYRPTAWGYVVKVDDYSTSNFDVLIGERVKEDDPNREGELVIPGGRLKPRESYQRAAKRETYEETGVKTRNINFNTVIPATFTDNEDKAIIMPRDKIVGVIRYNGRLWLHYRDSGKRYTGYVMNLDSCNDPSNKAFSDMRNPRFINFDDALDMHRKFTPACQILLELIESQEHTIDFDKSRRSGNVLVEGNVAKFLR